MQPDKLTHRDRPFHLQMPHLPGEAVIDLIDSTHKKCRGWAWALMMDFQLMGLLIQLPVRLLLLLLIQFFLVQLVLMELRLGLSFCLLNSSISL